MIRTIIWKGLDAPSLENCTIICGENEIVVASNIVGRDEGIDFSAEYNIHCNLLWQVFSFSINLNYNGIESKTEGMKDDENRWTINGKPLPNLANCMDIDISITPFTNSLPIHRQKLCLGEETTLDVVYIDVLQQKVSHVKQRYTHVDDNEYLYHNLTSDFESHIFVDSEGFVVEYPELFLRE